MLSAVNQYSRCDGAYLVQSICATVFSSWCGGVLWEKPNNSTTKKFHMVNRYEEPSVINWKWD